MVRDQAHITLKIYLWYLVWWGRDSSVGIATRSGLEGPGIESQWGARFSAPVQTGPPSLLYNGYRVFPGGKVAGAWPWPPTPSSAEVKERLELYLYSPSRSLWPFLGWTLTLLCIVDSYLVNCIANMFYRVLSGDGRVASILVFSSKYCSLFRVGLHGFTIWIPYTGRFIMYSGITKIYDRQTAGHVFTKPVQIEGATQIIFPESCFSS
jgi:hypothetical protein